MLAKAGEVTQRSGHWWHLGVTQGGVFRGREIQGELSKRPNLKPQDERVLNVASFFSTFKKLGVLSRNSSGQENSSVHISLDLSDKTKVFSPFFHGVPGSIPHLSDPWVLFHVLLSTSAGIVLLNI